MAKVLIGNFKGTKGDKGETGAPGLQGKTGATGQRGSRWTEGTAITGTSTTATIFSGTGIADALVNDQYLNTSTGNVYRCTVAGAASVAKWVYVGCIKGASGVVSDANTSAHGLMSVDDKKALEVLKKPLATCATGRATAAKVATLANFILQVGATIAVKFTDTAGTANPTSGNLTLNVNGTGAKTIGYFRNGGKAALTYASGNYFYNNATHIFIYDGAYWLCMDWNADNNTTYVNMTAATASAAGKAGLVPAPAAGKQGQYLRGDGTWATPANTVTTVVNNNTTTVAGYALDARQANPNVAGSLGAQIEALNSSLANGLSGKGIQILSAVTAFGSVATKIKLFKKLSELNRIIVIIATNSDMTGLIESKELYPQFFSSISIVDIIARYSPTAGITLRYYDDNTLEIWSCAQIVQLGFPSTMYCAILGF